MYASLCARAYVQKRKVLNAREWEEGSSAATFVAEKVRDRTCHGRSPINITVLDVMM
jgi:hypothetical protein